MSGGAVGQAGGGVSLPVENMQLFKLVTLQLVEEETLREKAPSPQQKTDTNLDICEKIRKEASLTPPGILEALCEGKPVYIRCSKAVFVEEVLELARMLERTHLLNFDTDC